MNAVLEQEQRDNNELEFTRSEAASAMKQAAPKIIKTRSYGMEVVEIMLPDRSTKPAPQPELAESVTIPSPRAAVATPPKVSDTTSNGQPFLPVTKHAMLDAIAEMISKGPIKVDALAAQFGLKAELLPQYSSNYGLLYRGENRGHPFFTHVEAMISGPLARVQGSTIRFKTQTNKIRLKHLTDCYGTPRLCPVRANELAGATEYVGITYATYNKTWGNIAFAFGATPDETLIEIVVIFWARIAAGFHPNGLPIAEVSTA